MEDVLGAALNYVRPIRTVACVWLPPDGKSDSLSETHWALTVTVFCPPVSTDGSRPSWCLVLGLGDGKKHRKPLLQSTFC